jgi:hypothetical protein
MHEGRIGDRLLLLRHLLIGPLGTITHLVSFLVYRGGMMLTCT